jgi:hypothetical protein
MTTASEPLRAQRRTATFQPKRRDTLRPRAESLIGQTIEWQALWVVTEEDGGDYIGQTVWEPVDEALWCGWVPDEDLVPA